jgi:hypothetical protein
VRHGVPQAQMTTYYVPFESAVSASGGATSLSQLVALVEVWDVALADGVERPVGHDVRLAAGSSSSSASPEYVLELRLPSFAASLYYDPSLNLGMLVGASSSARSKSDGIDDNSTLLAIAGVIAGVVFIAGVAVATTVVVLAKRRRSRRLTHLRKTLMHTTDGLVSALRSLIMSNVITNSCVVPCPACTLCRT